MLLLVWFSEWQDPSVFAISRGVNRKMERAAQERGLRLRSRVADVGIEGKLSPSERESLKTISDAAEGLNWFCAKAAWDKCNQRKPQLCNAVLHAAFRCGNYKAGTRIFSQMRLKGTNVTSVTYNCAIRLFSKLGEKAIVFSLWEEARNTWTSWNPKQKYLLMSEMVNALADAGNVTGIATFLEHILQEGLEIDEGTWGSALNGCKNAGAASVAEYFLDLMAQFNVSANLIHHTLVMGAYAGRSLQNITKIASKAQPLGIDTYFVEMHVTSLVGPYRNTSSARSLNDALKIVRQAPRSHNEAALQVIAEAQSQGIPITGLTERFRKALLAEKSKRLQP